jgi:VanZ family protein
MGSASTRRYLSLATAILLLVALHLFRPATSTLWLETLFDWMHVPVFALVAIGLFHALGEWRANVNKANLAFLACAVLAVLSEAAQIPTSRDASWADILSNIIGAAIGLLTIPTVTRRTKLKLISRSIAFILFVTSLSPLMRVSADYVERNRVFPIIYDGTWPSREEFMSQRGMAVDFRNLYPNWREYQTLVVEVEVHSTDEFPLTVRVHDKQHLRGSQPHADRFNQRFLLKTGRNVLRIPLSDVESAPDKRPLDLSRIDGLVIFSAEDSAGHRVRLIGIRLE